jgi:MFS transporter, NNP family, nitrate/nitrite transporter
MSPTVVPPVSDLLTAELLPTSIHRENLATSLQSPLNTEVTEVTGTSSQRGKRISVWDPEDTLFWAEGGSAVARRNLACSIFSEHIGFCVWSIWSVFVLFLGPAYGLSSADKFLLTTTPVAVGAVLRVPYTLLMARFGGRDWTSFNALLLLIPTGYAAVILKPGVSLSALLVGGALAGLGGANFSASMANVDSLYPQRLKGFALGLNAGGGNIGVAVAQLVGLGVLATVGKGSPRSVLVVFMPLVVVSVLVSRRYMNNIDRPVADASSERAYRDVVRQRHTWMIAVLYIGTFGSFIGFSFAFGQVLQVQFASTFDTPIKAAHVTFLGPLLGSLMRPFGGRLADRFGGAMVTAATFAAMLVGGAVVLTASITNTFSFFVVGFVSLFILTGIGNGSIYKMIPTRFLVQAARSAARGSDSAGTLQIARRRTRALIGLTGAIGSFGGVLVNLTLRQSFLSTHSGTRAYGGFIVYYALCLAITYFVYLRSTQTTVAV